MSNDLITLAKLFTATGARSTPVRILKLSQQPVSMPGIEVISSDAGAPDCGKIACGGSEKKHGRIDVLFVNAGVAK